MDLFIDQTTHPVPEAHFSIIYSNGNSYQSKFNLSVMIFVKHEASVHTK